MDFENVSDVDLSLVAGKTVHVTLLIGKNQKKLEVSLVKQIHQFAAQVELVELAGSGRNALDMTLAYYLGRAAQRTPDAQFCVVSKDKDFEPMLDHVKLNGVNAGRVDAFAEVPCFDRPKKATVVATPAKKVAKPAAKKAAAATTVPALVSPKRNAGDRPAQILARLRNRENLARPATLGKMLAHIKNALGKTSTTAAVEAVLETLKVEGTLTIDAQGRIDYA
ncbi:PIN domain-containing protein [Oleiharenicola lentus]|uniref:PIN domain-containing protein n=1 Tax=Oleiharenicola lentus TaxID=2508720 RepID=UPI003F67A4D1